MDLLLGMETSAAAGCVSGQQGAVDASEVVAVCACY